MLHQFGTFTPAESCFTAQGGPWKTGKLYLNSLDKLVEAAVQNDAALGCRRLFLAPEQRPTSSLQHFLSQIHSLG